MPWRNTHSLYSWRRWVPAGRRVSRRNYSMLPSDNTVACWVKTKRGCGCWVNSSSAEVCLALLFASYSSGIHSDSLSLFFYGNAWQPNTSQAGWATYRRGFPGLCRNSGADLRTDGTKAGKGEPAGARASVRAMPPGSRGRRGVLHCRQGGGWQAKPTDRGMRGRWQMQEDSWEKEQELTFFSLDSCGPCLKNILWNKTGRMRRLSGGKAFLNYLSCKLNEALFPKNTTWRWEKVDVRIPQFSNADITEICKNKIQCCYCF